MILPRDSMKDKFKHRVFRYLDAEDPSALRKELKFTARSRVDACRHGGQTELEEAE